MIRSFYLSENVLCNKKSEGIDDIVVELNKRIKCCVFDLV